MPRFSEYAVIIALAVVSSAYAFANTGITQPSSVPNDLMEGDKQLSCGAARDLLTRQGYQGVTVRSCFTFAYAFTIERNGKPVRVFVDPQNGRVWEG